MPLERFSHWRVLRAAATVAATMALFVVSGSPLQDTERAPSVLSVTAVRYWSLGDTTRIVVEVSGEFRYRRDRLANPDRVYFDIPGSKPALSKERIHTIPVDDSLLKQIRVSETQPGTTRVVLDLKMPADYSVSQLANPDRLVVELRAPGQPAKVEEIPVVAPPAKAEPVVPVSAAPVPAVSVSRAPAPIVTTPAAPASPAEDRTPIPAKKSRGGANSLVRALGLKLERVVLDPGHGGHDVGTTGPTGLLEKDLVLDVAQKLGALIEERLGAEVVYTRTDDTFVPLEARTALANEKNADLFLSIHANAGVPSVSGTETYFLNFTTSKTAMDVAARENASSERSIHELQSLIEKILLKDKVDESREFASRVQAALCKGLSPSAPRSRDRGVRQAPFVVLIGAAMPSVLTEIAFLSNSREERSLKLPAHRQKVAESLYSGVSQYVSSLSRFQAADQQK